MINKLLDRLGFDRSVPVSAIDDWELPTATRTTPLAPRGATATCLVDDRGRVQPADARFAIDWTLAAGARWVSSIAAERVEQQMVAPAVVETTVQTPSGPVVQRVGAAVVDGQPVAIVEIENTGGVAIAVGLVVRPVTIDGRGFAGSARVDASSISVDGRTAVRFAHAPAATAVSDGSTDLLAALPDPTRSSTAAQATSRAGAAQACAVFPLPHTATLRFVVELAGSTRAGAAVPTLEDVQRGWARHLDDGMRVSVSGSAIDDRLSVAARSVLTQWPAPSDVQATITALAEAGFGMDVPRLFEAGDLDRCDDQVGLVLSIARWWQLAGSTESELDKVALASIIGPVARGVHELRSSATLNGERWALPALVALADGLGAIDQPDVADGLDQLAVVTRQADRLAQRSLDLKALQPGSVDPLVLGVDRLPEAVRTILGTRALLVDDGESSVDLLVNLPASWRGESLEVMNVPVSEGRLSFGVRWHGPRPALLWQIDTDSTLPFAITATSIDPEFRSNEPEGEVLLADPGWPQP